MQLKPGVAGLRCEACDGQKRTDEICSACSKHGEGQPTLDFIGGAVPLRYAVAIPGRPPLVPPGPSLCNPSPSVTSCTYT